MNNKPNNCFECIFMLNTLLENISEKCNFNYYWKICKGKFGLKSNKELKILPIYFNDILFNNKRFELRKDDKNFKINDIIRLREFFDGNYTNNEIFIRIIYILKNIEKYGLNKDCCIFGFEILYLSSFCLLKSIYKKVDEIK